MMLRVNLVVMLLAVICVVEALQHSFSFYKDSSKINGADHSPRGFVTSDEIDFIDSNPRQKMQIAHFQSRGFLDDASDAIDDAQSAFKNVQMYVKKAVEPRKRNKHNNKMLALLMAYKMKLMALVPIMIGGVILLTSTTALAGFFFALFAAVLGLRAK
ncbi:uncharacterized protein LOC127287056 [Leptopilina boulardi]|uniref:uncharacterized protein LOC127287056 n=1 Tax=Leptopilina boulardi TaxID=63433 RepID=UPI0021F5816D|nr:uncharacterized protein LOC127287056 [Leptopilina boulardi]XP_051169736.1 uncharacterized protein LOC127287056 [Leptopilina boulardi]